MWKKRIYNLNDQIFSKIDLLIPAIGLDYYKEGKDELYPALFLLQLHRLRKSSKFMWIYMN